MSAGQVWQSPHQGGVRSGAALLPLAAASSEVSAPPEPATPASAGPWIERMVAALRLGDTLGARIRAHTVDYTRSERDVVIELLRDARGPTMRTLVEVREADPESRTRPVVFRIDSFPDGSVASWLWDIRWQKFIKMSGLEGTENFDGTHFHVSPLLRSTTTSMSSVSFVSLRRITRRCA